MRLDFNYQFEVTLKKKWSRGRGSTWRFAQFNTICSYDETRRKVRRLKSRLVRHRTWEARRTAQGWNNIRTQIDIDVQKYNVVDHLHEDDEYLSYMRTRTTQSKYSHKRDSKDSHQRERAVLDESDEGVVSSKNKKRVITTRQRKRQLMDSHNSNLDVTDYSDEDIISTKKRKNMKRVITSDED